MIEPRHIEFREVETPSKESLGARQVLINVKRIGVCGSEIHSYHGLHPATFYPVVQGHEYSGTVVAVGADVKLRPGRLADLAPTLLALMGYEKPIEMTGESLIVE